MLQTRFFIHIMCTIDNEELSFRKYSGLTRFPEVSHRWYIFNCYLHQKTHTLFRFRENSINVTHYNKKKDLLHVFILRRKRFNEFLFLRATDLSTARAHTLAQNPVMEPQSRISSQ